MDVVAPRSEEFISGSAPGALSPCRRASSFPFFGTSADTFFVSSALKIRSHSESEGLNRFPRSKFAVMPLSQLMSRGRLHTQAEENSDGESTSSDSADEIGSLDGECHVATGVPLDLVDEDLEISFSQISTATRKKSVRFADDCGSTLCSVKVMTEPQEFPPKIPTHVLKRYRGDSFNEEDNESPSPMASWIADFKQPACEYMKFRETIDNYKVALENVMIKNDVCHLSGTVKVANIAFEKKVFIRYTSNGWRSYLDRVANFQPSTSKVYDTFAFNIEIPRNLTKESRIEFCVCYEANGHQFWDSNGGKNYSLVSDIPDPIQPETQLKPHTSLFGNRSILDRDDAYRLEYDNWTRFASWKQLSTDGPYW